MFICIILLLISDRNGNLEVPVYLLKVKQRYTVRKKERDKGIYINKCRYEIQEQKEFPVWHTGM
jgi:hypothetical protein